MKRIASQSPSTDTGIVLKKQTLGVLDDSFSTELRAVEQSFENDTPHWVPLLFASMGAVREELCVLSGKMDAFETFKANISDQVSSLCSSVETIKSEFDNMKSEMAVMKSENAEMKSEMAVIKSVNAELRNNVGLLITQVDRNEQHSRSECLLLHGVPEKSNPSVPENSKVIFAGELSSKCEGITITEKNIKRAHRYGPPRRDGKPRPIIARFWDAGIRNSVYTKKKNLKGKGIFITENLTKFRMMLLRKANDDFGKENVWTKEGRIFARDGHGQVLIIIS